MILLAKVVFPGQAAFQELLGQGIWPDAGSGLRHAHPLPGVDFFVGLHDFLFIHRDREIEHQGVGRGKVVRPVKRQALGVQVKFFQQLPHAGSFSVLSLVDVAGN